MGFYIKHLLVSLTFQAVTQESNYVNSHSSFSQFIKSW